MLWMPSSYKACAIFGRVRGSRICGMFKFHSFDSCYTFMYTLFIRYELIEGNIQLGPTRRIAQGAFLSFMNRMQCFLVQI